MDERDPHGKIEMEKVGGEFPVNAYHQLHALPPDAAAEVLPAPAAGWLPILRKNARPFLPEGFLAPLDWQARAIEQQAEYLDKHFPLSRLDG